MGCFFRPMRSRMLLVMRSKMGRAASEGGKSLFLQCFVGFGRAAVTATGLSNMQRRLGAACWIWGIFQEKIGLWHLDLHPRFRRVWGLQLSVEGGHAQNCGENGFFWVRGLEISMERPKTRDLEKWQNIFVLARPSSFCAFSWRAWISPKTGFSKSTNFRWNHWKRQHGRNDTSTESTSTAGASDAQVMEGLARLF